jgi:hypothetical protein
VDTPPAAQGLFCDEDGDTAEPIPFDLDWNPRFIDDAATGDTGCDDTDQCDLGVLLAHWGEGCP